MKNKLFLRNLKAFFEANYESQFAVLSELESKVQSDSFSKIVKVKIGYDEYITFELKNVSYHKNYTLFTYDFLKGGVSE